jgi:isoleucyl-tRNA synthetase
MSDTSDTPVDYKPTVFLPKTPFPMRAGLPKQEPEHLARWEAMDLYGRQRAAAKGRETFVLHDGPPYANGHLHIGHALNKILKDVIVRSQQMMGKDSNYVPGWDCHGLPIEWKIEEDYRAKGQDKDAVPRVEFRRQCRDFADKWVAIQREEFKRLGVIGDWAAPYTTMTYAAEAQIVRELGKFIMNGGLYRGAKPVMWSVVEKTALAEAEVEYHDHTSTMIWIRFPVVRTPLTALEGSSIVIWTTTPWTMPGNRAIAYGPDIDYALLRVTAAEGDRRAREGERLCVAEALLDEVCAEAGITGFEIVERFKGRDIEGTVCHHPWHGKGYDFEVPLLGGAHVTTEQGTGFVHTAPGHGEDDYILCRAHAIAVPDTVAGDGTYYDHVPLVAGAHVYKVAPKILELMTDAGALLASGKLVHSYPHSWRSKAPLIFRTTPQWFISMDENGLREKALAAIDQTRFVPAAGMNRLRSMIETRPDWCVSRQRAWGVPITVFVHKATGEVLRDQAVLDRVAAAVEARGADAWFEDDPQAFLGALHKAEDYEQVFDILDVWFDSGCTHSFVLEARDDLHWPADLYLEGSDQHRGWFHSSLLESCGTRGRAPYEAVLTHGFTLDEQGRKMSKSLGNVISPQEVVTQYGADILRLWVVSTDYTGDQRIGPDILKQTADMYRRLRNTLRFLLGALEGYDAATEQVPMAEMPELERWVLHRLSEMDRLVRQCCHDFDFHTLFAEINQFCTADLSAFYFDIRKDALYCDAPADARRKACRTVLDTLYGCLITWLAPFLSFTAEEAWLCRHGEEADTSVHLQLFPEVPAAWRDDALAEKWAAVRKVRRVVLGALEVARNDKKIGASLQAHPTVHLPTDLFAAVSDRDMEDVCITSALHLVDGAPPAGSFQIPEVPGVGVVVALAEGEKCQRCWKVLPDVGSHRHAAVCGRCDEALGRLEAG